MSVGEVQPGIPAPRGHHVWNSAPNCRRILRYKLLAWPWDGGSIEKWLLRNLTAGQSMQLQMGTAVYSHPARAKGWASREANLQVRPPRSPASHSRPSAHGCPWSLPFSFSHRRCRCLPWACRHWGSCQPGNHVYEFSHCPGFLTAFSRQPSAATEECVWSIHVHSAF